MFLKSTNHALVKCEVTLPLDIVALVMVASPETRRSV